MKEVNAVKGSISGLELLIIITGSNSDVYSKETLDFLGRHSRLQEQIEVIVLLV